MPVVAHLGARVRRVVVFEKLAGEIVNQLLHLPAFPAVFPLVVVNPEASAEEQFTDAGDLAVKLFHDHSPIWTGSLMSWNEPEATGTAFGGALDFVLAVFLPPLLCNPIATSSA